MCARLWLAPYTRIVVVDVVGLLFLCCGNRMALGVIGFTKLLVMYSFVVHVVVLSFTLLSWLSSLSLYDL